MGDSADYVKFVTKKVAAYWENPRESAESRRERRRKREPWILRWFGQLLPVGIMIWWNQRKLASLQRSKASDSGVVSRGHPE